MSDKRLKIEDINHWMGSKVNLLVPYRKLTGSDAMRSFNWLFRPLRIYSGNFLCLGNTTVMVFMFSSHVFYFKMYKRLFAFEVVKPV